MGDSFPSIYQTSQIKGFFVKKPGSTNYFYLIYQTTLQTGSANISGVFYAEIDMALNGGNGGLVSKNNFVDQGHWPIDLVKSDNGVDYYFTYHGHNSGDLKSIEITSSGIGLPVNSSYGTYIMPSYDYTVFSGSSDIGFINQRNVLKILEFQNGIFNHKFDIRLDSLAYRYFSTPAAELKSIFTSPDGSRMHCIIEYFRSGANHNGQGLLSFNTAILDSAIFLNSIAVDTIHPDYHLIYFLFSRASIIWFSSDYLPLGFPNPAYITKLTRPRSISGRLNIDYTYIPIANGIWSRCATPPIPNYLIRPSRYSIRAQNFCLGDSSLFNLREYDNLNRVYWDFGDPANPGITDSSRAPAYQYLQAGTYTVTAYVEYCNRPDTLRTTITIHAPPVSPQLPDTAYCGGSALSLSLVPDSSLHYVWSTGDSSHAAQISSPGWHWVELSNVCFSTRDSFYVSEHQQPQSGLPADTTLCMGSSITYEPLPGEFDWQWQDGSRQPLIITESGSYPLLLRNACGSFVEDLRVQFEPAPSLELRDTARCEGQLHRIELPRFWQADYLWHDGLTDRIRLLDDSGWYSAQITNPCGTASDSMFYSLIDCECHLYLPNAFTPNGDGLNDELLIATRCPLSEYSMEVYDRWGKLVFRSTNLQHGWDGRYQGNPLPPGAYPFVIRYTPDGRNPRIDKGLVNLIR
ncbi:MAG: gliding motility-associated C-terminal domain-containing protein [Bacteroidia bacterium]